MPNQGILPLLARGATLLAIGGVAFGFYLFRSEVEAAQIPFGGAAWAIPGTIEAENFDEGGEGVSYHDTTTNNEGGASRDTAVDVYAASEAVGGYFVRLEAREWVEFTVNVEETALYDLFARVFLDTGGGEIFHFLLDDLDVAGSIHKPGIGGPATWGLTARQGVVLKSGQHVLRLYLSPDILT